MVYKVVWSIEAEKSYTDILIWINQKWTKKELTNFINRTKAVISMLEKNPGIYQKSNKGEIHRAFISRQTSLYYKVTENEVYLLAFSDNRESPKKTEKKIS